ncbi:MAG: magnesium transporter MgtE [Selenomonadales bacterium]|nr:magnesium transporter MgtE [Selenomonadales bacterium]
MAEETPKKKKGKKILKLIIMLILLAVLIVGGFALGIYLRLFDTQAANEKLGLYNLPIIGQYFVKPAPTQDEMENMPVENDKPDDKDKKDTKKVTISKKEIEQQMKEREAAEKKRVSKLARLYNEMKPRDAAEAMDSLDDDLVIAILQRMDEGNAAKVLSEFQPAKTARLTQLMYEGTKKKVTTADDVRKMMESQQNSGDDTDDKVTNIP